MLWTFSSDGNFELAEYMLSLPGVQDPAMGDGTTAFSMALARRDFALINLFLSSKIQSDINHHELAKEAILELDRGHFKHGNELRDILSSRLLINQELPEQSYELSKEYVRGWVIRYCKVLSELSISELGH